MDVHNSSESLNSKLSTIISEKLSTFSEAGDYWHPDPEQDKRISGAGNKLRAREDQAASQQPKEDPKKLRPGESYSDYSNRIQGKTKPQPAAKPSLGDRIKSKLGKAIDRVGGINSSYEEEGELVEAVDRAEYGKIATEPAPKDDKKAAYAFKDNKNRQRDLKKLARLVRHADGQKRNPALYNSFEAEGEVIDERTRERKGQPRPARNRATEMIRKMPEVKKGLMTRSGKTVAQHEKERGVKKEPGAPTPKGETTADRLEAKKRKAAISKAAAQRSQDNMSSRFD